MISIVPQVAKNPKYALQVSDIRAFEQRHGRIPAGSVVMVRSDWSKKLDRIRRGEGARR